MYKIILAIRYLIKQRITYLAVLIVVCCVFMAVVVLTVMTGLVTDFKQKNHDFVGDCVVGTDSLVGFAYYEDLMDKLEAADFVESVSPVIKNFALLSPKGRDLNVHVEILGIEPVRHSRTTGFGKTLYHRRDDVSKVFEPIYDPNLLGCVLGIDLALSRDANSKYSYETIPTNVGFSISCFPLTAKGAPALGGLGEVNTRTFYYSDNSHSGLARVDSSLIYLPFQEAQQLCMAGTDKRASAIHIKFKPNVKMQSGCEKVNSLWENFRQEKAGEKLAYLLDTVSVQSWKDYRRAFIAAMEKEQTVMAVMFAFVGIVIVFIVLLTTVGFAQAQRELSGTVDVSYVSKWLWRGFDMLDDKSAIQPSVDIDLFGTGFSINVWASYAGSSQGDGAFSTVNKTRYDYTLAYSCTLFEGEQFATDVKANFIYYDFIDEPDTVADTEELGVGFSWPELCPAGIVPSYYVCKLWNARSNSALPSGYSGWLHIFGLGYDLTTPGILPDTPEQVFNLSAAAVYNDGAGANPKTGAVADHEWSHIVWGVSTKIEAGPGTFTPAVYYQTSMDSSVNPEDELWAGLSYAIPF